ncbi:hypothetical protein, partial [Micromonospora tarensis]
MTDHADLAHAAVVAAVLGHRLSGATSVLVRGPRGDRTVRVHQDSTPTEVRAQTHPPSPTPESDPSSVDVVLGAPGPAGVGAAATVGRVPVWFARHHGHPAQLQERLDTLAGWLTTHPDRPVREAVLVGPVERGHA